MIRLLAEHHVLTTDQLARLAGFRSLITAQHRLATLAERGVLARFRHYQRPGTQAWRYTLGMVGELIHAAATETTPLTPARLADRVLSLAASPRLAHHLAVAEVFASLAEHARTHPGCALLAWWPERRATEKCQGIARPDAYGEWAEHGYRVGFFLELDRGTEPLQRVTGKLIGYQHAADTTGELRAVLFVLPTGVRERHLHAWLTPEAIGGLVVATATSDHLITAGLTPADAVWLLPGGRRRVRLIELGAWR